MNENRNLAKKLDLNYEIKHKVTKGSINYNSLLHNDFEIFFANCDGIEARIDKKNYNLKKNTLVLLNSSDPHWFSCSDNIIFDRYISSFNLSFLNSLSSKNTNLIDCFYYRPFPDPQILELKEQEAEHFINLQEKIIKISNRMALENYGQDLEIIIYYSSLLLFVNNIYRKRHHILYSSISLTEQTLIYKIINYINESYFEEITLDTLAEKFNIDKFTLCRLFSKITGISPIKYLINCRLNKAQDLLQSSETIEKICYSCGFNNLSNFSKSFKAHYMVSPKAYQMKIKNERK